MKNCGLYICENCQQNLEPRYNPFASWHESDNNRHYDDNIDHIVHEITRVLEDCKSYQIKEFNEIVSANKFGTDETPMTKMLSSLFLNIDGNFTNFDQFCSELKCLNHKFTAIGLAETNTHPETSKLYKIPSYKEYYQSTSENKKTGTGVCLYIHESINVITIDEISECSQDIESLFVKSTNTSTPIIFGVIYRPNDGSKELFYEKLETIFDFLPKQNVYILGDYNVNLLSENGTSIYEDCFMSSGYTPLISTYAHERPGSKRSCIDNIFTNNPQKVALSGTISDKMSHHLPIFQFSNIDIKSPNPTNKNLQLYDFCNKNLSKFVNELEEVLPSLAPEYDISNFLNIYKTTLDKHCKLKIPKTTKRTTINNPWISDGIIESINRKYELKDEWTKTITNDNPDGDKSLYEIFSSYRKTLKHVINQAKQSYKCSQFQQCKEDPKKTWNLINELRGVDKNQKLKPPLLIDNEKVMNRRLIANAFNKYFVSIASKLNSELSDNIQLADSRFQSFTEFLNPSNANSMFLEECNSYEIMTIISDFQNGKASDIPIRVIKKSSSVISSILANLYNKLMISGIFPQDLKVGKITPIFKKGNSELLENYRPISTLPIFGKIFEKIIYIRIYKFLTSQNILHSNQYGFRKSHSTTHALNYSVSHIDASIKQNKHVLGIFIDLSKAFDTIDHPKLLYKLQHCGIRGITHKLLESYLTNRYQYTECLDNKSMNLLVQYGVPQGSVLGPLLFLLYINDITNCSKLGEFILFADDTNIFITGATEREAYCKANILLHSIDQYMNLNQLHINKSKCCYIYFKPRNIKQSNNPKPVLKLKIGNHVIKKVTNTKFLGVTIDENLSWDYHIKDCKRKLNYAIATLSRIKKCIPESLHKDLYHTLFESHLTYCISVWGGIPDTKLSQLHIVQKKCIRIMFGDTEAYKNKFKTCVRARQYGNQILSEEFYKKENSKPLFEKHKILAVRNLFTYHCFMEIFKILKFQEPSAIHSLYKFSRRGISKGLITPSPSTHFIYKSAFIWNKIRPKLMLDQYDMSISLSQTKNHLKTALLQNQHFHDKTNWHPSHDFNFEMIAKIECS